MFKRETSARNRGENQSLKWISVCKSFKCVCVIWSCLSSSGTHLSTKISPPPKHTEKEIWSDIRTCHRHRFSLYFNIFIKPNLSHKPPEYHIYYLICESLQISKCLHTLAFENLNEREREMCSWIFEHLHSWEMTSFTLNARHTDT